MEQRLGIVLTKGNKNYLLLAFNKEKESWAFGSFPGKKELLDQVGADDLMELITHTVQWAELNPIAINLPEKAVDLRTYTIQPYNTTKLFTGSLGSRFMGAEVKNTILELQVFNVFTELAHGLESRMSPLTKEVVAKIKAAGKKTPVKKAAPKKKIATKKAQAKKVLTKKK
jgi:hypothetical protein